MRLIARFSRHLMALFIMASLSACHEDTKTSCPDRGDAFFKESVSRYFSKHPPAAGIDAVKVLPGASYNSHLDWWVVPVDVGTEKWTALLSCDGRLELSGRGAEATSKSE